MNKRAYQFCIAGGISLWCLATTSLSQAQITSDGTLSTDVTTSDNLNFTITGGSRAGGNLFHSLREFSVRTGGSAFFDNALDVQNIITRVTGDSISNINGLIRAHGSANLFLINPKGIIFGPNAALNIGGSFLASTANGLNFADGTSFSATDPQAQPLLTISVPIGLQFRETAGRIVNQSIAKDSMGSPGFQVKPSKTLALVGGDVFIEGGKLFALGGRIELGSVAGTGLVSLTPITEGWSLGYEGVQNFQDIQLSQAGVDTTGESSGDINLRGRRLEIIGDSQVTAFNDGANPGGTLVLKASESVEVSRGSALYTGAFATGAAADITIETKRLIVGEDSFIETSSSEEASGRGGNLTVDAFEFVKVSGSGGLSQLSTRAFDRGNAGDLKVTTGRLILRDGGQILSSTEGAGNGGTLIVDASESVKVSGSGETLRGEVKVSGLFADTKGTSATGNGGVLRIDTERLVVQGGGSISVAAVEESTGQAGTLDITASESTEVSGTGSTLLAESESPKPAGDLTISTGQLIVRDGAEVSVSGTGEGPAGTLEVNARSIRLDKRGSLRAETRAGEGNITLQAQDIILRRNSEITTSATGEASGGNIKINTDVLAALENSDIKANAKEAEGGRVSITAQGIFGTQFREQLTEESDITATSALGPVFSGTVELNTPEVDPSGGLIELPENVVDPAALVAQNPCKRGWKSEFTITGRGGLPPSPNDTLSSEATQVGLVEPAPMESRGAEERTSSTPSVPKPIMPAQGWVFNTLGEVVLTAYNPTLTGPQRLRRNLGGCPTPY